jgi:lysophospholipase L1-like esterase
MSAIVDAGGGGSATADLPAGGAAPPAAGMQAQLQRNLVPKSRGLGGSSDLTLLAKVKPGFIDSLESVTYKTRVKRVLDLLHAARMDSHEYHAAQLLSDSVERVGAIQSVRVAVFEPEDEVLLSVSFDGPWEAYIRVLWDKVRPLLDLIFCSTEEYPAHAGCSFEEWLNWARRVQRETGFFYGPPAFTARDVLYARRLERTRMRGLQWIDENNKPEAPELTELRTVLPSAEQAVERLVQGNPGNDPADIEPGVPRNRLLYERFRTGMQSVAGLYRLTDLFVPGTPDGDVLHRAATNLLREFTSLYRSEQLRDTFREARLGKRDPHHPDKIVFPPRFRRELDWLFPEPEGKRAEPSQEIRDAAPVQPAVSGNDPDRDDERLRNEVQGGILHPYEGATHGLVLLVAVDGPAAAARLLDFAIPKVTVFKPAPDARFFCNIAFTPEGLRACGLQPADIDLFPEEFLQGMAARAGLLGDVRHNHPRRWRLPESLRVPRPPGEGVPVQLSSVHVVVQLRTIASPEETGDIKDPRHPLQEKLHEWLYLQPQGVHVLAVEAMKRNFRDGKVVEHFGFADGESEPKWGEQVPPRYRMRVGEAILGYDNAADTLPPTDDGKATWEARMQWLRNGSFLVLRKYRQFPERLDARVQQAVDKLASWTGRARDKVVDEVYAKLLGRHRDGRPLAELNSEDTNDFSFDRDPHGKRCPLHAHIRLANRRPPLGSMARPPRILRRGMSWEGKDARGLVFMAYNASITEQFEVIQRWLTGGNATGSSSGPSCPILGVPENGVERHFAFERDGKAVRVQLEARTPMFDDPQVLTQLDWGLYLFTPSMSVLGKLRHVAREAARQAPAAPAISWNVCQGAQLLAKLPTGKYDEKDPATPHKIQQWKAALEDSDAVDRQGSAALWAAIRAGGGLHDTPYGVVVADRELILSVLKDPHGLYSIKGQDARMRESSIGPIFLGMDRGPDYDLDAQEINPALVELSAQDAFEIARQATLAKLTQIRDQAADGARRGLAERFQVSFDAREIVDEVLASLCDAWFFGPGGSRHFIRGSADWTWENGPQAKGIYPGHFIALSRYMFQPHPGERPKQLSIQYGEALVRSMRAFVDEVAPQGPQAWAPVTKAVLGSQRAQGDPGYAARTMAGVIMGFTPPITGALLNLFREWARDGRFWQLRAAGQPCDSFDQVKRWLLPPVRQANRMRPMPQVIWRTALADHTLTGTNGKTVAVKAGDKLVLGLVSGTQQSLEDGKPDGALMFGGDRRQADAPTHACPGYEAGMGAMAGTLAAMLAFDVELRPGLGAMTFDMAGPSGYQPQPSQQVPPKTFLEHLKVWYERFKAWLARTTLAAKWAVSASLDRFRTDDPVMRPPTSGPKGLLFAWGDSWFDYVVKHQQSTIHDYDLVNALTERGFTINDGGVNRDDYCNWDRWAFLGQMAESISRPDSPFLNYLSENLRRGARAILLSGGGNDSVRETLDTLLHPRSEDPERVVNHEALARHLESLERNYAIVIDGIRATYAKAGMAPPPIVVHGYDNPIPFVDGYVGPWGNEFQEGWLQRPFIRMGYTTADGGVDVEAGRKAMAIIIGELNTMLKTRVASADRGVHHIDFRGTLQPWWQDQSKPGWFDNLHANKPGFQKMAEMLEAQLDKIAPKQQASMLQRAKAKLGFAR